MTHNPSYFQHSTPRDVREEGEREEEQGFRRFGRGTWHVDEVALAVIIHYTFYFLLTLSVTDDSAKNLVAIGLHQTYVEWVFAISFCDRNEMKMSRHVV